jgi:hypothetical protein
MEVQLAGAAAQAFSRLDLISMISRSVINESGCEVSRKMH